jgi:hypothetical protein
MDLEAMQERINEAKARQHVIEHGYERTYFLPLLPTLTLTMRSQRRAASPSSSLPALTLSDVNGGGG